MTYTDLNDAVILAEYSKSMTPATVSGVSTNTVLGVFNSPASEGLFGLGQHQQPSILNFKGQTQVLDEDYGTPFDRRSGVGINERLRNILGQLFEKHLQRK